MVAVRRILTLNLAAPVALLAVLDVTVKLSAWAWCVGLTCGVVLTIAAADVAPRPMTYAARGVALALLGESFGRDVLWLWRRRSIGRPDDVRAAVAEPRLGLR